MFTGSILTFIGSVKVFLPLSALVERLAWQLNAATMFRTAVPALMHEAIAPVGFSFEPPLDSWLEDIGKQNAPSPGLIVPVVLDRLEQCARMPVWIQVSGSSHNVGS
jgi:hypothetical protein